MTTHFAIASIPPDACSIVSSMSTPPPAPVPGIAFGSHTDVGQRREHNEDSHRCEPLASGALLVVCDGVGGAKAGEVASRMAADGIYLLLKERAAREPLPADRRSWLDTVARELDERIRDAAQQPGLSGMAATLSALWLDSGHAWWVQAGDSRIYLLRGTELRQISRDQSPVGRLKAEGQLSEEEARKHPYRHMIDQCLGGGGAKLEPDTGELSLQPGDVFLLCSDGLSDGLWDREIAAVLEPAKNGTSPAEVAKNLVERANQASGSDNITAVVAHITQIGSSPSAPAREPAETPAVAAGWRGALRRIIGPERR
jgi:PPM family protein phosphatase